MGIPQDVENLRVGRDMPSEIGDELTKTLRYRATGEGVNIAPSYDTATDRKLSTKFCVLICFSSPGLNRVEQSLLLCPGLRLGLMNKKKSRIVKTVVDGNNSFLRIFSQGLLMDDQLVFLLSFCRVRCH